MKKININKGDKFGEWEILEEKPIKSRVRQFLCKCSCGTEKVVGLCSLNRGRSLSCGCQGKIKVNKGDVYNYLTVIGEKNINGNRYFTCQCVCGNIKDVSMRHIRNGHTKSCGCMAIQLRKEQHKGHGLSSSKIYGVWNSMKQRCNNPNDNNYHNYGGRGIKVDDRWNKFELFYEDMKEGYSDQLSIDRIDNNGNYCKKNCKWVTQREQCRNTRKNTVYDGKCITERGEIVGLSQGCISTRIQRGMSIHDAIFTKYNK